MSKLTHFFIKHAGKIRCEITGSKRYSSDLVQGGFKTPAKIIFQNSNERIIEEMKKKLAPLKARIHCKMFLSDYFMKHSLIRISSHLIWFHEIHIKYVKRKPLQTMIEKNWIQKGIKCPICYW